MKLYKDNGEVWDPHWEDIQSVHTVLRQVVDAIRFQRGSLDESDAYAEAVGRLSEAAVEFTTALRACPDRAAVRAGRGPAPWTHGLGAGLAPARFPPAVGW